MDAEQLDDVIEAASARIEKLSADVDRLHAQKTELLRAVHFLTVYAEVQARMHPQATDTPNWLRLLLAIERAKP